MTKTSISSKQIKPKVRNFPIGNNRRDQRSLGLGKEFWDDDRAQAAVWIVFVDRIHQRQVRGEVPISTHSQQSQSQLLVCGTSERWNSMVERAFVGRVSSWMKPRKRKCWHTGSFFLCVCVCECVYMWLYVCFYSRAVCTYKHRSMPHVFISMCLIFESLSLDPELCHWLELLPVKSGASWCCCHHSSTDDTISPSFYLIAEHLNPGPHVCLEGTLPALLSFSLALPGPGLEWVFPSQKIFLEVPSQTPTWSLV